MTITEAITDALDFPDEVLANHFAVLGKTGSGKTYAAKGVVERLIAAGERVCVIDPNGAWWGLRLNAAGDGPGLPVTIFGGDHGDLALSDRSGEAMARLVAERSFACVIDLDGMTQAAKHAFAGEFFEHLFRLNDRPLYLILDEADDLAPQNPLPESKRMLGAVDRIVRRGRRKGFRCWFITQRPAVLHKNVLTQAESLLLLRLVSTQDRRAVQEWIRAQADEGQEREVFDSLARLGKGDGWVWMPERGVLERTHFPPIRTYDSSRTPEAGSEGHREVELAPLSDDDLGELRSLLAEAEADAEANSPKALRARIEELEEEIRRAPGVGASDADRERIAELERRLTDERERYDTLCELVGLAYGIAAKVGPLVSELSAVLHRPYATAPSNGEIESEPADRFETAAPNESRIEELRVRGELPSERLARTARVAAKIEGASQLPKTKAQVSHSQQAILDALGWFKSAGLDAVQRSHAASVAGVSPRSSGFDKNCSTLRTRGLIDYPGDGMLSLTREGQRSAARPAKPATLAELHQAWLASPALSGPQREMVRQLVKRPARVWTRAELAQAIGVSVKSSGFDKNLSRISALGLADYPVPGSVRPGLLLFPEGLK